MTVDCRNCRSCGAPTKVVDSRNVQVGALVSTRRLRRCEKCRDYYRTLEMPDEIGLEMWSEDDG